MSVAVRVLRRIVAHAESSVEDEPVRTAADEDDARRGVALDVAIWVVAERMQVLAVIDVVVGAHVASFFSRSEEIIVLYYNR